ncbi:replication initiation protein [Pseudobutyrivibrio xylanivorans]|uniref:Replication initiation protein n=1 Tax=Pseudobutyrivibrio xylanivorans TaxID=185007 RepID=A0A5P6VLN6_PSEXY|nr:replication initiation protein [Pseudobutyrivibrio xylanivorans]QFJ53400.1 replication initiation protein [Pseudobutyrivibrio xylanivorans]QFJ53477.1 replication initiation protein [Pseudobutyrivibrio xylanivorans]
MAIKKQDEYGNYRTVDPTTGQFIDEYPLTNNLGGMEHQTVATNMGNVVDLDEQRYDVVDVDGNPVLSEDETQIREYIKAAISVDNLVETFSTNSHAALLKLLALQDNKHPLKKGGVGIAYRTDALIMHCKMEFTAEENVVFDAILGTMSSFPENVAYRIEPSNFVQFSRFQNDKTLYNVFRKGTEKLKERHLKFEELGPDGEDDIIVPWFDILRYHKKKNDELSYIEFKPSDFFKDLALCSQLVHGAYGSLEVTTQLRGKYTIALYWFLENKKRYKEYPNATPGVFDLELEEFKHQFSIPDKYYKSDIERRVLRPAYESINEVDECDFTFEYQEQLKGSKLVGYRFIVKEKNYIDAVETKALPQKEDAQDNPLTEKIALFINAYDLSFSSDEINRISACASRNNRDAIFVSQILLTFKQRIDNTELAPVEDKLGYVCRMIEQGATPKVSANDGKKAKNSFHNFSQRDVDMDELEKALFSK